MLRFPFSAAK